MVIFFATITAISGETGTAIATGVETVMIQQMIDEKAHSSAGIPKWFSNR